MIGKRSGTVSRKGHASLTFPLHDRSIDLSGSRKRHDIQLQLGRLRRRMADKSEADSL